MVCGKYICLSVRCNINKQVRPRLTEIVYAGTLGFGTLGLFIGLQLPLLTAWSCSKVKCSGDLVLMVTVLLAMLPATLLPDARRPFFPLPFLRLLNSLRSNNEH
jgi:hypothetical protein